MELFKACAFLSDSVVRPQTNYGSHKICLIWMGLSSVYGKSMALTIPVFGASLATRYTVLKKAEISTISKVVHTICLNIILTY